VNFKYQSPGKDSVGLRSLWIFLKVLPRSAPSLCVTWLITLQKGGGELNAVIRNFNLQNHKKGGDWFELVF